MELGRVYHHWILGIAHHPAEGVHLAVGDAGEVVFAIFGFPCPVHKEVEDELGTACYVIAVFVRTADEDVARGQSTLSTQTRLPVLGHSCNSRWMGTYEMTF